MIIIIIIIIIMIIIIMMIRLRSLFLWPGIQRARFHPSEVPP